MKLATLVTALALIVASTRAAECSPKQLDLSDAKWEKACASSFLMVFNYQIHYGLATDDSLKKMCEAKGCLGAIRDTLRAYPDCEVSGTNILLRAQRSFNDFQQLCADVGVTIAPIQGWPSAATTAGGASAAAVVVVVALVAHV